MRLLAWVLAAASLAGCGAAGDPRQAEIWVIDFQTHGAEVAQTVAELDLDAMLLEELTLRHVEEYFEGLAISFELGIATRSRLESGICVRHGVGRIGRGIVDTGNTGAVFDCGTDDGIPLGAYVNQLVPIYQSFLAPGRDRETRTDLFARLLALVIAHEVGHGLGLEHGDALMAPSPFFDVETGTGFSEAQRATLRLNLAA